MSQRLFQSFCLFVVKLDSALILWSLRYDFSTYNAGKEGGEGINIEESAHGGRILPTLSLPGMCRLMALFNTKANQ